MSHLLQMSCGSSDPSPQSSWRLLAHLNSPGRQVFWEQDSASSSLPSEQSITPSQCQDTGMHLLFLHWNWLPVAPVKGSAVYALICMMPVIPCLIIMFPPPSLFLISNTPPVLVSDTYR
uniref:Uncharacterized protein n=1 Tax=Amphilophus citrinellus TaxID=61819 RepID=A0A3Q0RWJ0_AMPCI